MSDTTYAEYAKRGKHSMALFEAMDALNPYRAEHLSAAWRRGFYDSYKGDYDPRIADQVERVAYTKGYTARRDIRNVRRFPLIEVES